MKKIIIVNNNLNTGGVQTSLVNFLKEIHDLYDITLLLFNLDKNAYNIPENIRVITINSPFKYLGMSMQESKRSIFSFLVRSFFAVITKLFGRSFAIRLMSPFQRKITGYDYAISYLHEGPQKNFYGGCNEFVLRKIEAKQKATWLHCDFKLCGANNDQSRKIYSKFDKIIACSEGCRKSFIECIPELESKTLSIRNCNDYANIKALAKDAIEYSNDRFNIVTVARLSEEKGIERALTAVYECIKKGHQIKYHIVGSGDQESLLKSKARELGIEDSVVFYGNQSNPYKYIKNADLFLLTSYHEAAPMVFDESACLGVPVLATKTTSTDEMILESKAGFVCENSQDGITNALLDVLSHKGKLASITEELKQRNLENSKSVVTLKAVIDS